MPSLLEIQDAVRRSIVERDDLDVSAWIVDGGIAPQGRLSVYRNTFASTLIRALRLSHPAVDRLVGAAFFDAAAREFITRQPPRSSYLDEYGSDFADFLERFPPAASVPYLSDVARLEWAVSRAIHAPDAPLLTASAMKKLEPANPERVCFQPHPSVSLVRNRFPADEIWRAVLDGNDAALQGIDVAMSPVWLIVHRGQSGVEVARLDQGVWKFIGALLSGCPLGSALANATDVDAAQVLADLLVRGYCTGFDLAGPGDAGRWTEGVT
jgi:Putative DNA-binding domain